ncbi:MAG: hypothetical protein HZA22_09575 [Nitrospirae bacterium]|nr:hypothetical protein [Nitrospirota bacterium]MBI5695968.1 hypothetical protein [Nitrospirota bacterium]
MKDKELWIFLFVVGAVALDWPLLAIFRDSLPAYLFAAWLALIAALYLLSKRAAREGEGG